MVAGFVELLKGRNFWLRGVDLNHRPLGYEFSQKRNFSELAGVVA
jgi:hypothetical protein